MLGWFVFHFQWWMALILSCLVSFSLSDFDSDNMEMEFGKFLFYTFPQIVFFGCIYLNVDHFESVSLWISPSRLRRRSASQSAFCPLIVLVPSVRRDGHLWPGAGQQYPQEALSGEVQHRHLQDMHKNHFGVKLTNVFHFKTRVFLCAGPSVLLFPPSRGSALLWSRCRSWRCWAITCWRTSVWSEATRAGFSSHPFSRARWRRRWGYAKATTSCWYVACWQLGLNSHWLCGNNSFINTMNLFVFLARSPHDLNL